MSLLYPFYRNATGFVSRQWSSIYLGKKCPLGRCYTCMKIIQDAVFSRAGSEGVLQECQGRHSWKQQCFFLKSSSNHGKLNKRKPSLWIQESSTWFSQPFQEWKHHFRKQLTPARVQVFPCAWVTSQRENTWVTPPLVTARPLLCRV